MFCIFDKVDVMFPIISFSNKCLTLSAILSVLSLIFLVNSLEPLAKLLNGRSFSSPYDKISFPNLNR